MKLPHMRVPLFDCGDVYLCQSQDELTAFYRKFNLPPSQENTATAGFATTIENQRTGHRHYLVFIATPNAGTVAHEAAHVAFYICRDVGIAVQPGNGNETFCYLLSAIVRFINKHLNKSP